MKGLLAVGVAASLALSGCGTTVYGPNGKKQFRTYGDVAGLEFRGPGTSLLASRINHSTPTKAAFNGVTSAITAAGAAVIVP